MPNAVAPTATTLPDAEVAVFCPLCEYDLRGLEEPRCPECGYRFTWAELNDPALRLHPYAFEHHPERNVSSFRQTLLGGLRPWRFWRTLFPTQPSQPRRLFVYWILAAMTMFAPLALQYARQAARYQWTASDSRARYAKLTTQEIKDYYAPWLFPKYGSVQAYHDIEMPLWPSPRAAWETWRYMRYAWAPIWAAGVLVTWPWLTFGALMVFQVSMRRVRLRPIHVLRCVVYASDVAVWVALATLLVIGAEMYAEKAFLARQYRWGTGDVFGACAVLVALLVLTVRLAFAYRLYLRFHHAIAVALASQLIVWLIIFKVTLDIEFFPLN